jgi:transforming growth factor-beta-induced protein
MAFDENPDEVFDNEPEADMEGNGDEQSNRSFRMMMIGLFAFGGLGVLLIALLLIGRSGDRQAIDVQNQAVQATNAEVIRLSQITPTRLPTDTPKPTNTAVAPTATPKPNDLVDAALAASDLSKLAELVKTAGLENTLKGQGPYTIFAPTNDAFAQLSPETLDALSKDPAKLATLLKYHVVNGAIKADDAAKLTEATTLEGQPVEIAVKDGKVQINDATVTQPDQQTANGVIHTINKVLVPPELREEVVFVPPTPTSKDLVDAALSSGNFKTLSELLNTAGLVDALKARGPFTIFAPTDDAFAQLSPESLEALKKDPKKLAALLKYHVVEGAIKADDAAKLGQATTLEGKPVEIAVKDGKVQINGATVTGPDQQTANGVIHTINKVLVPPELSKEVVVLAPSTPKPGAAQTTPAAGKGTAVAQVQPTKLAAGAQATAAVPTRVPPAAATSAASASTTITNTGTVSGTNGTTDKNLPKTGANDNLFLWVLAALGLVGVLVVARRLRTSQG